MSRIDFYPKLLFSKDHVLEAYILIITQETIYFPILSFISYNIFPDYLMSNKMISEVYVFEMTTVALRALVYPFAQARRGKQVLGGQRW